MKRLRHFVGVLYRSAKLNFYWLKLFFKVPKIRRKNKIKVLFVVSEASTWKTEQLYRTMERHPRFEPIIGISTSRAPANVKNELIKYLDDENYPYCDLDKASNSIDIISPDIIFYYKPYGSCYSEGHYYNKNLRYVFCGLDYGPAITTHIAHIEKDLFDYCWQFYVDNEEVAKMRRAICGYRARNVKITGVPMQDRFLADKKNFKDPWRDKTGKKRIIYAPHHSFRGTNGDGLEYATFLENGEALLAFAKKYSDLVTFVFKPHPNLYMKLVTIWGKSKTDSYYEEWENLPNTQLERGEYVGLFKYSDAIIHDCASFIIEYLYVDKPGLYLVADTNNQDDMFNFVKDGFNCYEHGRCIEDIEMFIQNIIKGYDAKREQRKSFVQAQLLPPNGKTACENIISAILGE